MFYEFFLNFLLVLKVNSFIGHHQGGDLIGVVPSPAIFSGYYLGGVAPPPPQFPPSQEATPTPLPEIIVNRKTADDSSRNKDGGYVYERPENPGVFADNPYYLPPTLSDFPPTQDYLPPSAVTPLSDPPTNEYLPPATQPKDEPQRDMAVLINFPNSSGGYQYSPPPTPLADPPSSSGYFYDPPTSYLPPRDSKAQDFFRNSRPSTQLRAELKELVCLTAPNGFFKAQIGLPTSVEAPPVVDTDSAGDSRCDIRLHRSVAFINILSEDFSRCGVLTCGADLCLRLRFPQIKGLKTGNDAILTLQCRIQPRVVARTHAIRMNVAQSAAQGRSTGNFAQGGGQSQFRSQIGVFRRAETGNAFTKSLTAGGMVQLGEDLMLRAQVRQGDGWNHTRLSDVALQRFSTDGELMNSVNLVTQAGCVNPTMRSICPADPVFEPPLGYRFGFRAFMFQGMRSGDEMMLSVKMIGCVHRKDCTETTCESRSRWRRKAKEFLFEEAKIAFKVEIPTGNGFKEAKHMKAWTAGLTIVGCCLGLLLILGFYCAQKR